VFTGVSEESSAFTFNCEAGDEMYFRNVGNHVPEETEVLLFTTVRTSHFIDFNIIIGLKVAYSY
jgi:hypothetical protein